MPQRKINARRDEDDDFTEGDAIITDENPRVYPSQPRLDMDEDDESMSDMDDADIGSDEQGNKPSNRTLQNTQMARYSKRLDHK